MLHATRGSFWTIFGLCFPCCVEIGIIKETKSRHFFKLNYLIYFYMRGVSLILYHKVQSQLVSDLFTGSLLYPRRVQKQTISAKFLEKHIVRDYGTVLLDSKPYKLWLIYMVIYLTVLNQVQNWSEIDIDSSTSYKLIISNI